MPDDKQDNGTPLGQDGMDADRTAALQQAIRQEMDAMTKDELERLYAAIAFMESGKDK